MELKTIIRLVNNVYHVEVALNDSGLTPVETEAINAFGAPTVSCGGNFGVTGTTGSTGTNTYFTLADNDKAFPTNFPVKQVFSLVDYPVGTTAPPNAAVRADTWRDTIVTRTTTAVQGKRTEAATYVGTTVTVVDTTP